MIKMKFDNLEQETNQLNLAENFSLIKDGI
jgi:hypothetical protein